MQEKILVTGGAGFIGTHTVIELIQAGHQVVVVDNLVNSNRKSLEVVERITGVEVPFYEADIRDTDTLRDIFKQEEPTGVIHFAGLKAVGESTRIPLAYYDNNIAGTVSLLKVMEENNCKNIIFSSSATVYGDPHTVPILEDFPLSVTNPYGRTKLMLEEILTDIYKADSEWNVVLLRYFNPIGAHESGDLGENPNGIPNNLLPYVTQVAVGKLEQVQVFGDDYDTEDGTGVRDYIHVVDLAKGHVAALQKIQKGSGLNIYNLGTGKGYSVLEIIQNMEKAVVSGIAFDKNQARINVRGVPDKPGIAYQILGAVADANVDVDMIIQNVGTEGTTDFSFTVPRGDYKPTLDLLGSLKDSIGMAEVSGDDAVCKVSIVGLGMRSHVGVAARMFHALASENINIQMISTSEVKVSVLIDEKYMELATRVLHKEFGLDKA